MPIFWPLNTLPYLKKDNKNLLVFKLRFFMKKLFLVVAATLFFLWGGFCWPVWAATLSLVNVPDSVFYDQEFLIEVYFNINAQNTIYYLRPCFYLEGSTSYFGCVKVGEDWVCDNQVNKAAYLPIVTNDQGVWQGQILVLAGRNEVGEFNFKIRRYTAGGSSLDSDSVTINLIEPEPQVTPTLLPTPTPDPSPLLPPTSTPTLTSTPALTPTLILTPTPNPAPTSLPQNYDNIFLNEIMANPAEGPEWVELYNANNFTVDLENWFLDDLADGGSSPQKFSLTMEPYGYEIITLTRAIFNNTGDEARLLNFAGQEKDHFSYSKTVVGQSWGKNEDKAWCLQEPSPGEVNRGCFIKSPTVTTTPTPIPKAASTENKNPEMISILGQSDQSETGRITSPTLKTYLIAEDNPKPKLRKESSSLPSKNWLPDWLLLSGGALNFGVGLTRVLRKITS